jgi:hypothetical protein
MGHRSFTRLCLRRLTQTYSDINISRPAVGSDRSETGCICQGWRNLVNILKSCSITDILSLHPVTPLWWKRQTVNRAGRNCRGVPQYPFTVGPSVLARYVRWTLSSANLILAFSNIWHRDLLNFKKEGKGKMMQELAELKKKISE